MTKYIVLILVLTALTTAAAAQIFIPDSKISKVMRKKFTKPYNSVKDVVMDAGHAIINPDSQ